MWLPPTARSRTAIGGRLWVRPDGPFEFIYHEGRIPFSSAAYSLYGEAHTDITSSYHASLYYPEQVTKLLLKTGLITFHGLIPLLHLL